MLIPRLTTSQRSLSSVVPATLLLCLSAHAQEAESEDATDARANSAEAVEETVVVTGIRTRGSLHAEAGRATEAFYARLNEVLDNEDYEITCRTETRAGSDIRRRVCLVAYQEELLRQVASQFLPAWRQAQSTGGPMNLAIFNAEPAALRIQKQFEQEVLEAVNTDLELNQMVVRLMALKSAIDNYETPRQQRRRLAAEEDD